jgi:hypothetical protein
VGEDNMAVYVANASGEEYDSEHPSGYDSWIDYWNKKRYPGNDKHAGFCRNCKTKTDDLDGGHVELYEQHNDRKWYPNKAKGFFITPLCSECNNSNNTELFSVEPPDLIKIP